MSIKQTQGEKILKVLQDAKEEWINGRIFLRRMMISQYHARIYDLQRKGHKIEASDFVDKYGFKSYKLLPEGQLKLFK